MKERVITGKPIDLAEMVMLTGKDALADMDGYKARILSATEGQSIECDVLLMWGGHFWGLRKLPEKPDRPYDYMAYIVVR